MICAGARYSHTDRHTGYLPVHDIHFSFYLTLDFIFGNVVAVGHWLMICFGKRVAVSVVSAYIGSELCITSHV